LAPEPAPFAVAGSGSAAVTSGGSSPRSSAFAAAACSRSSCCDGHGIGRPSFHAGGTPLGQRPRNRAPSENSHTVCTIGDGATGSTSRTPTMIPRMPMKRVRSPARIALSEMITNAKPSASWPASETVASAVIVLSSRMSFAPS
jgi:hypothetical protein